MDYEAIAEAIVASALRVHTKLGPGLLESAYEACLAYELKKRALSVVLQVPLAVKYDDMVLDIGYRVDMLVAGGVVVEVKAVDKLLPVHAAQLLTYLRLGEFHLGFLLNFNAAHLRDGIKRVINGYRPEDMHGG
ncbi:MAG TPA: GxxExxY protein [Burkholderiales bacterium]|nr:GxxExxY protein [Burkholderiales bacterium]